MNKKQKRLAAKEAAAAKAKTTVSPVKGKTSTVKPASKTKKPKAKATPTSEENELDNQSATAVVKKITKEKDLKYNYPEDVDTLAKRKKFRAEVRRTIGALERTIAKLMGSDKKEDKVLLKAKTKEADSYLKEHLAAHKA